MSALAACRAEAFRLRRTVAGRVLLFLPLLAGAARTAAGYLPPLPGAGGAAAASGPPSGFGALADGLKTGAAVLALLALALGAVSLVRDRENGALGQAFLAARRDAAVLGRALALVLCVTLAYLSLFATVTLVAWACFGLGPVVEEGYEMASAAELWGETLVGAASALPALFAAALFGLTVSSVAATTGAAVAGTLIPFVLFDLLKELFPDIAGRVFASHVPFLGDGSTLARLQDISRAYAEAEWGAGTIATAVTLPLWQGGVLLVAALAVTARRPA